MSVWFASVKRYYDMGIYTKANVVTFVKAGMISETEYEDIIGEAYV